jgi:hypothetical protein
MGRNWSCIFDNYRDHFQIDRNQHDLKNQYVYLESYPESLKYFTEKALILLHNSQNYV